MYSSTVIVQLATLFSYIDSHGFVLFFYGLFARRYIVFDVCIFKKKKRWRHLCIVGAFCQVHLVGLVCLPPFFWPGFFLLCSRSRRPTGNTAFYSEGSRHKYNRVLRSFFHTMTIDKRSLDDREYADYCWCLQKKLCILEELFLNCWFYWNWQIFFYPTNTRNSKPTFTQTFCGDANFLQKTNWQTMYIHMYICVYMHLYT